MARALSFLIRYFSNYYTLHRSDLAARAALLDPRLEFTVYYSCAKLVIEFVTADKANMLYRLNYWQYVVE